MLEPAPHLSVDLLRDAAEAAAIWRDLIGTAPATIYQTRAFAEAWLSEIGRARSVEFAAFHLRAAGRSALLLPVAIERAGPIRVARFLGGKHANFNLPLMGSGFEMLTAGQTLAAIGEAARAAGLDVLVLINQPETWQGSRNPLIGPSARLAPSAGHLLHLDRDPDAVLIRLHSKEKRRKLRQKAKWLGQLGTVSFEEAQDAATAEAMLETYFRQKALRFERLGIDNPFASEADQAFLRQLAKPGSEGSTVLRLFALRLDQAYVSIWGAGTHAGSASGMITSFDETPAIARTSPGELLLERMLRQFCLEGLERFDFGVGEAPYKIFWSDETVPLYDLGIGLTQQGHVAASLIRQASAVKRAIKQSPRGMRLLAAFRRLKAR